MVAPEQLRAQLRGRSLAIQLTRIEQLHISATAPVEHRLSVFSLQSIAARVRFLSAQLAELDPQLLALIKQHPAGPTLLAEPRRRPRRRRAVIDLLVPPRARPQRGRVRLAGWRLAHRDEQRSTLPAPPQPRWRPRSEPGTAHRRHHPTAMPPRIHRLRDQADCTGQDAPRYPTLSQTRAGPTTRHHQHRGLTNCERRTGCCASTCTRTPTCPCSPRMTWTRSPRSSIIGPAGCSAGPRPPRRSGWSSRAGCSWGSRDRAW